LTGERTREITGFLTDLSWPTPFAVPQWCSGGSREPIEVLGKLQDCFPRAGISQLTSHLPRLLGTVEPLQGFIQNRRHLILPHIEN
jgi:hypothetical protein